MSQEQWKPIAENPEWGMVSNMGRVMGVRGMTQREIAAEFGVGQPALNVFLRGRKTNHFAWRNPN